MVIDHLLLKGGVVILIKICCLLLRAPLMSFGIEWRGEGAWTAAPLPQARRAKISTTARKMSDQLMFKPW